MNEAASGHSRGSADSPLRWRHQHPECGARAHQRAADRPLWAGRFIFGVSEGAIFIALVAGLAQWFSRSGIALATSLYLSLARAGSYAVDTSTAWARPLYERGWQPPLWLGTGIAIAGLIAATLLLWRRETGPDGHGLEEARKRQRADLSPSPAA